MRYDKEIVELPSNFNDLKKAAFRTANWKDRINAVDELGRWKSQQTIDILSRVLEEDGVYRVREAAYNKLVKFGEDASRPTRKEGELFRDIKKILTRIKKSLPENHTIEDFKEKFKKMRSDVYDTYEGEKGAEFDQWIENMWASLSKK
ncbi:HEAT repeat domain-containing protein [Alkaliphilus hydrothermalis]|uniref:HEAT repeat-containing protein n=1 Tax=Alkaliphilus hydrothermalis TaxID=1482730 RepID=A0ABS2NTZ2_9FIRM|nr:HEAT repeat domain-containing protein [Alkaliphilus hydrothermalis]MBM7616420.1 hypothetical protein [Alkaliphilus hydrothermalis]